MLDTNTIRSNIKDGSRYYTKEENQGHESESEDVQALTQSEWFGSMAPDQPYSDELFTLLFKGDLANGDRMRGEVNGKGQERLAYDLTFKVPGKSLSLAIHAPNGDLRLWDAHVESIKEVLGIVETNYASARKQENGERQILLTGNIAATLVHHHESRAGDPHVHSHVVLFNGTHCPDGEYRALYIEPLIQSGILGDLYHQKLALKVQALGYEIRETATGFELAGVTDEQIAAFSKRSTEIDDYLQEKGWDHTPENRQRAAFETRLAKDTQETLTEKRERWATEMAAVSFQGITPSDHAIAPRNTETPRELLDFAIADLSENQSSFSREDLQRSIFNHLRYFDEVALNQEIDQHPELIEAWDGRLTTQAAFDRDINILQTWLKGNDRVTPLNARADFSQTPLNPGQAKAMRKALQSTDQYQVIKGLAGVGKTFAMKNLRDQLPDDIKIHGFAATHEAKDGLSEALGIEAQTVAKLAVSDPPAGANQLWVFDEMGMIGSDQFSNVLAKAEKVGARVLMVGDTGQNPAIEAGSPLKMVMQNGATVHKIDQIIRQQNQDQKTAVQLIANGNGVEALNLLESKGYVHEVRDTKNRITAVVDEYMDVPIHRREKTLIVTGTNAERRAINKELRSRLQAEGTLTHNTGFTQLKSRHLTKAKMNRVDSYQVGDLLVLHRKHRNYTQLKTHIPYQVTGVEGEYLKVESPKGRVYKIKPSQHSRKEVYTAEQNEIAVGDKLRFTKTRTHLNIYNGTHLTCVDIKGQSATVEDIRGKRYVLDLNKPQQIDHDWCTTSYRSQGTTKSHVIYSATLDRTSCQESFYVATSRQTLKLSIYTPSIVKLRHFVSQSNAQTNAFDVVTDPMEGRIPDYVRSQRPGDIDTTTWKQIQRSGIDPSLLAANSQAVNNPVLANLPFMPSIPDDLAEQIYRSNEINPTPQERAQGIWQIADEYGLPLVVASDVHQVLASTSQGHLTVGLSDLSALFQLEDQGKGKPDRRLLTEAGKQLAQPGRTVIIAGVQPDLGDPSRLRPLVEAIEVLQDAGVVCKLAAWSPQHGQGIDQLIDHAGPRAYNVAIANAVSPVSLQRQYYRQQYEVLRQSVIDRLGDIPDERVDLEIYQVCTRRFGEGDADRFIRESHHLRHASPQEKQEYLAALHQIEPIYKSLQTSSKGVDLNARIPSMVEKRIKLDHIEEKPLQQEGQYQGYVIGY